MNQRIETPSTSPIASSKNDALVLDIAHRLHALASEVAETVTMSPADAADQLGQILSRLSHEHGRLGSAREVAYEFAGIEAEEARDARWDAEHNGGMP